MLHARSMGQRRKEFERRLPEMQQLAQCKLFVYLFGFFMATLRLPLERHSK